MKLRFEWVVWLPLSWAVATNEVKRLQRLQQRQVEVTVTEHDAAQKPLKEASDDLAEMEMYMQRLRHSTHRELEDDEKRDVAVLNTFSGSDTSDFAPIGPKTKALAFEAEKVKVEETAAKAEQHVSDLRLLLTQQEKMLQARQLQFAQDQRRIAELQDAVKNMQAEASADVAADHQLELKYQKQGQKYQKEVEELEVEVQKAKKDLSTWQSKELHDQQGLVEGKEELKADERHLKLKQENLHDEEHHEDAMQHQVEQMQSDIDTNLVSIGASVPQMASHDSRLTELVRVASQKQQEIEKLEVNISSLEAEVQQDTMQLEQQKAKQAFDTQKIHDEIQEVRQKKIYRVRAAQDMYHKLPELFNQRAQLDQQRRSNEATEAEESRRQQRKLREEKEKEREKADDEELRTELSASKVRLQRLQSMDAQAKSKRSLTEKRIQQLREKIAGTKQEEAEELKKFMQRSSALQEEMHQDEVKGNEQTSEKAAALEKMQAEMLALDDQINRLEQQQSQVEARTAELRSTLSLQQMQDEQDLHNAKMEEEKLKIQKLKEEKQEKNKALQTEEHWKAILLDAQRENQRRFLSMKRQVDEKERELSSEDEPQKLQMLQSLAQQLRVKETAATKMQKFLEKEPGMASAVKHTLRMA